MKIKKIQKKLKALANPKIIKIWKKLNSDSEIYYGIKYPELQKLAKEIGKNHDLAIETWKLNIHDARLLSILIEEPDLIEQQQISLQAKDFDSFEISDSYCKNVIAKSIHILHYIPKWIDNPKVLIRRSAFILIGELAKNVPQLEPEYFERYLKIIESNINIEENLVQEAMIFTLNAIGDRHKDLKILAGKITKMISSANPS